MKHDPNKLNEAINISSGQLTTKINSVIGKLKSLKIPEDEDGKLDFSNVNSRAATIKSNASQVADLIEAFLSSVKNADSSTNQMAAGLNFDGLSFSGDSLSLNAGDKFYASASGDGSNGTIGSGSRPAGDGYFIDRVAIEVDGKLVGNVKVDGKSKEDIEKAITDYAKENGLDTSEISITPHVSYENNGQQMDTGWLSNKKLTMSEVEKTNTLEDTMNEINKKYQETPIETIKNGVFENQSNTKENPFDAFSVWETTKKDVKDVEKPSDSVGEKPKDSPVIKPKDGDLSTLGPFSSGTTDFSKAPFEQFMPGLNLKPIDEQREEGLFYHPNQSVNGKKYEENITNGLMKDNKLLNVVKKYDVDLSKNHYMTDAYTYVNNGKESYLELGNGIKIHDDNTITVDMDGKDVEIAPEMLNALGKTHAQINEPVKDEYLPYNLTDITELDVNLVDNENNQAVLTAKYYDDNMIRVADMDDDIFVVGMQEVKDKDGNPTDTTIFGYNVNEKGELVPISAFGEYNKDSLQYGGNQNMFGWRGVTELLADENIWGVLEERYPGSTYEQKKAYLSCMAGKCCGFVANVNGLFEHYEGREEEFKEKFGVDMYRMDENGKLDFNYEYMTLKYWDYVYGEVAGRSIGQMSGGRYGLTPTEHGLFDDFLKDEFGVEAESTTFLDSRYNTHHIEDTITGSDTKGSILSGQKNVVSVYEELSKKYESVTVGQRSGSGGHAMYVVGENDAGSLDLSSLGHIEHPNYGCNFKFYVVDYKD